MKKKLRSLNDNNSNFNNIDHLQKIKKQLNTIKTEMNEQIDNSLYYFLYKSLIHIVDVGITKINILIEKNIIENEKNEINKIENKIKILNAKISGFENAKNEIKTKYQKTNTKQITKQNNKNINEEKNNNKSTKDELNKLKLLIGKMENNYVNLLKNLSKKIIKPKNLIIRTNDQFLKSKIK